jgi:hypothetical protein
LFSISVIISHNKNSFTWKKKEDILLSFLSKFSFSQSDVLFTVSARLGLDIAARADCRVFWWQSGGITEPEQYLEYFEKYPYLKKDWHHLFSKHKVTHVFVDKGHLLFGKNTFKIDYDFSGLVLLHENDKYISYSVPENYSIQYIKL